jgi:hypothetical protein
MRPEVIKELKGLQNENPRLRKIIADPRIDMEILKEDQELFLDLAEINRRKSPIFEGFFKNNDGRFDFG